MLRMTTQTPIMPEYNRSGTETCLQCLSRLPTVQFSTHMPAHLPPKALLPSQDMLTAQQPHLMMIPLIDCMPRSINQGELELLRLLSLLLPMTGKTFSEYTLKNLKETSDVLCLTLSVPLTVPVKDLIKSFCILWINLDHLPGVTPGGGGPPSSLLSHPSSVAKSNIILLMLHISPSPFHSPV